MMIRLRELRESRNLSQTAFAKTFGVAQNTVSNWENGNRILDVNTATNLANFFEVSVDYLIGNSDIRKPKTPSEEGVKKGTIKIAGRDGSFIERELTDDQIDLVKRMVDQMPRQEDKVITAYRNKPAAQPKVDKLLAVEPETDAALIPLFPDPKSPINYWDDQHVSSLKLADDSFSLGSLAEPSSDDDKS